MGRGIAKLKETLGEDSPIYQEYSGIVAAMVGLTNPEPGWPSAHRGKGGPQFESLRERLQRAVAGNKDIQRFLGANLADFAGKRRQPSSFCLPRAASRRAVLCADLLAKRKRKRSITAAFSPLQIWWGVRVEDPLVFDATHALVKALGGATRS